MIADADIMGQEISSNSRFRHKVVLVSVMGSWRPGGHDEAPFLEALASRS